jgi:predicted ABC-type exoprotein transport system permease subunit
VTFFTSDWFQAFSSGIPIASFMVMRITMTLTRRNGQLVPLGQNEALRILLARSDHEMHQHFQSHSEQSFFIRVMRLFVALAQTAFPLHR